MQEKIGCLQIGYDRIALVLVAFTLVIVAISLLVGAIKGAKVGDGEEANDTNEPKTHAINLAQERITIRLFT